MVVSTEIAFSCCFDKETVISGRFEEKCILKGGNRVAFFLFALKKKLNTYVALSKNSYF